MPALTAPAGIEVKANADDIELATRQDARFLYLFAVRRGTATTRVAFSGLPTTTSKGETLFEYADGAFRPVTLKAGVLQDWFGPHDAHAYRFPHAPKQPAS